MSKRPNYMPEGDDDYIDWEGNLLTSYPPYQTVFGSEVIEEQDVEQYTAEHGDLVAIRDAASHAEDYKQALNAVRSQIIDGSGGEVQLPKPDPKMNLSLAISRGGRAKEMAAWVKRIKAAKVYNPQTHGLIFRIEAAALPAPDYLNMRSTGYTEWDGKEWLRPFRTLPRGTDGYHIYFDMGDGKEELKGSSGLSHGWVKAPTLPANGLLMFKLITRLTHQGKEVGRPTWQILNLQRDLPAKFGVQVEDKKGTLEQ